MSGSGFLRRVAPLAVAAVLLAHGAAWASGGEAAGGHHDPVAPVVLALAFILVVAKLGGELAGRLGQPPVLGELLAGVVIGNLSLVGIGLVEPLEHDVTIDMLARIGVLILLFQVGLESTVAEMLRVGASALLVAVLGVVAPFALGWGVGAWMLPGAAASVHAFLGATLCATSVGITARVLKDLGRSRSDEARTILGAAVIDDVLGLMVLAVVSGVIGAADRGAPFEVSSLALVVLKAVGFLVGAVAVGLKVVPRLLGRAARLRSQGVLLTVGLALCFGLAWAADAMGLAPIVGAFAAGLVLEPSLYGQFVAHGERPLEEAIEPLSGVFVPVFFVLMGMRTDLRAFAHLDVLGLAAALTVAAVLGKQACAAGVLGKGVDRLTVALGMLPRGEVGLIFASIGSQLKLRGQPVIDGPTFSAVVVMVIVTTLVTPPLLKWRLAHLP